VKKKFRQPEFQKTIKKKVQTEGLGLFVRRPIKLTILPAPPDSGIVINGIKVCRKNITPLPHRMSLRGIKMPEHFLSVCYGLGIDNLKVELSGNEFPFFDGSGREYLNLFQRAQIKKQKTPVAFFSPRNPLIEFYKDSFLSLLPGEDLEIKIFFSFPELNFSSCFSLPKLTPLIYKKEIAWARTFGQYPFPSYLRKAGIPYQRKEKILYPKRLRSPDEFIRHKILDLLGDLKICGRYIKGKIFTYNPSHRLNYKLLIRIEEESLEDIYGH